MDLSSGTGDPEQADPLVLHGSAVEFGGCAAIMLGPSGSGKSALALKLMALGANLVADDIIVLRKSAARIEVSAPPDAPGLIEARGVGLLAASCTGAVKLRLVVDMACRETERLPPRRRRNLLGTDVDLVHGSGNPNLAAAIMQYLKSGRDS